MLALSWKPLYSFINFSISISFVISFHIHYKSAFFYYRNSFRQIPDFQWVYYITLSQINQGIALYRHSQARYSVATLLTPATCCGMESAQGAEWNHGNAVYSIKPQVSEHEHAIQPRRGWWYTATSCGCKERSDGITSLRVSIQGCALIYLRKRDIINSPINKNLARW